MLLCMELCLTMTPFFQVTLRTTDVEGARAFYSALLGGEGLDIVKLHEQALARGAPAHWLPFLDVGDVDRASGAFLERGATPLGTKWVNPQGLEAAVMRDPGGAVVALAKPPAGVSADNMRPTIAWFSLNTNDVERAKKNYGELFGWHFGPARHLGRLGVFHPFAYQPSGLPVGVMTGIEGRTGMHPHWLIHFRVGVLSVSVNAVLASGGVVVDQLTLSTGERIAVCQDPQGAAFALQDQRAY